MELRSFWSACETIAGASAVEAEWRRLAGDDYDAAKALLRPMQEPATSYPCPRKPPCACFHRVVHHDDGSIVAVCRCDPQRCDTVALTKSDIIVYELDRLALYAAISNALSLRPSVAEVPDLPWVSRIGFHSPCAGYRFPAYLILTPRAERFTSAVFSLAANNPEPSIVISPTDKRLQPGSLQIFGTRKSLFLTLSDILSVDESGMPVATKQCTQMLTQFHLDIVPALRPGSQEASPIAFFPTPAGAAWSDVQILFRDGHTVSVSVGNQAGVYNFAQMGMSRKNTGEPNAQWTLLEAFAAGRGVFDWDSEHAGRTQKKQKQLLSQSLRDFFRIEDDPFRYSRKSKGWEAMFNVGFCQ